MDIGGVVMLAFTVGAVFGFLCLMFIQKTHVSPLFDIASITLYGMLMDDYIDLKKKYDEVLKERNGLKLRKRPRKCAIKRYQRKQESYTSNKA